MSSGVTLMAQHRLPQLVPTAALTMATRAFTLQRHINKHGRGKAAERQRDPFISRVKVFPLEPVGSERLDAGPAG